MRKIMSTLTILAAPLTVQAQPITYLDRDLFAICVTIMAGGFVLLFLLEITKRFFEYRLKNKILELGVPEDLATTVLKGKSNKDSMVSIKWFFIFTVVGIGLTIITYTRPLGIHSLAIMAFSLAAGFLGFFFFIKRSSNN